MQTIDTNNTLILKVLVHLSFQIYMTSQKGNQMMENETLIEATRIFSRRDINDLIHQIH